MAVRRILAGEPESSSEDLLRQALDDRELVAIDGRKFIINPITEQVPATAAELLHQAAERVFGAADFGRGTKIVGEEDKGGVLVAAVSLVSGLPFGLARWYPSGLKGQVSVDFESEYAQGRIYLNGVDRGDKVIIVDDLISTGGTMIALISAIKRAGADVADIICLAEKIEYEGCRRVKEATGLDVKCLLQVSISGLRSKVLN